MQVVGWKTFFGFLEIQAPEPKKFCGWESKPITKAQKNYLRKLGIGHTGMRTKGQASMTIQIAENEKEKVSQPQDKCGPCPAWATRP